MTTTSSLRALLSVGIAALLLGAVPASAATADTDPKSPFAGTSVSGVDVDDDEQVPEDAPRLSPGVYTDELASSEDSWRAYRVTRTAPGSTLHVSLTTKPSTYDDAEDDFATEDLRIRLLAADGAECHDVDEDINDYDGTSPFATATGVVVGEYASTDDEKEASCRAEGDYTVLLGREGPEKSTEAEIQVLEEPPVANLSSLPKAMEATPDEMEVPAGKATPITGGTGFTNAPQVTSGTWSDTLTPGEARVYRVKVDYGETARFTVNGPTGGFRYPGDGFESLHVEGRTYAPDRQFVDRATGNFSSGSSSPASTNTAKIRYLNRESDFGTSTSGMGGWHYFVVSVGDSGLGATLEDQPVKVAFSIKVDGTPSDEVDYDYAAGDWEDPSDGSSIDLTTGLAWAGGGLLGTAALLVGGWFVLTRARKGARG